MKSNGAFDTRSCAGGLQGDDTRIGNSRASYDSPTLTATLTLASPLAAPADAGSYRLFVCGTTSVWSVAGLELNNGAYDTTLNFTLAASASSLPATGFAPGRVTSLPAQPASRAYAATELTLEIPALEVSMPIVGVPQTGSTWDVTWLGGDAGWLNGSAFPTWAGNTVLTGHVWDRTGPAPLLG